MEVSGRHNPFKSGSDDDYTDTMCEPCTQNNKWVSADSYCVNCDEFLCSNCEKVHRGSKLTKDDVILERDEMPRTKLTNENFCTKHGDSLYLYYCKSEDQLCCADCFRESHKECDVEDIKESKIGYSKSGEYQTLTQRIDNLQGKLENISDRSDDLFDEVEIRHKMLAFNIKDFRQDINEVLDYFELTALGESGDIRDKEARILHSISRASGSIATALQEIRSCLQSQEKYKLDHHLVLTSKRSLKQIFQFEKQVEDLSKNIHIRRACFHRNQQIVQLLHSLTCLGTIEDENYTDSGIKLTNADLQAKKEPVGAIGGCGGVLCGRKQVKARSQSNVIGERKAAVSNRSEKRIKVKSTKDRHDCLITGCVEIGENRVAIVDSNNYCVKIFNTRKHSLESRVALADKPLDITCMNSDTLVVTCTSTNNLTFLNNRLSVCKQLHVSGVCLGIASHDNKLFVTFTYPKPALKIYTADGVVQKAFTTDKNGKKLFYTPGYITISRDGRTVIVSDSEQNTVTSLSLDGQVNFVYKHDKLKCVLGVTLSGNDDVFVAGCDSHNIHQITPQGHLMRVICRRPDWCVLSQ